MELSDRDKDSELWKKLVAHFNELLEKDRRAIEKTSISMDATFVLRGRIKLVRDLLDLGNNDQTRRLHEVTDT